MHESGGDGGCKNLLDSAVLSYLDLDLALVKDMTRLRCDRMPFSRYDTWETVLA